MTVPLTSTWAALEDTWAGLDSLWARGAFLQIGLGTEASFVTVTDSAFSVSVSRGRNRDLERTNAGTLSASFRNNDRRFDPKNSASDLDGYILPRNPVRANVNGEQVFVGVIDDWNFDYEPGGQSVASLTASDGFSLLARQNNAGSAVPEEDSGDRINTVLDQSTVNWPAGLRDIDAGNTTLGAETLEGNALSYLQAVEESEAGLLFITKQGALAFRERLENPVTDAVVFTDDGVGIPYEAVEITFGSELLANRSTVTSAAGSEISENLASIAKYGVVERDFDTLLSSAPQLSALGQYIVERYGEPEYRIERVTVNMRALNNDRVEQVLGLEIGDQADVVFTPNQVGAPIALRGRIIGISHDVGVDQHRVTFSFEELPFLFFILDDDPLGRLDNTEGLLGF